MMSLVVDLCIEDQRVTTYQRHSYVEVTQDLSVILSIGAGIEAFINKKILLRRTELTLSPRLSGTENCSVGGIIEKVTPTPMCIWTLIFVKLAL